MEKILKKVVKFGGSSLADAGQFKKVKEIIMADKGRRFVVPSAPGKRFSGDDKVTDLLLACQLTSAEGGDWGSIFAKIEERYNGIIRELGLSVSLHEEFSVIRKAFADGCTKDYAASRGEYLNGILLADYLGYEFIDAATVVFFDKDGNFDAVKTNRVMGHVLESCENAVIPGFFGRGVDGEIVTFSRGGSDITGAIVARAVTADIYENWTDVSGFLMADPRIVENPKPINIITYRELRELAYMGASVLHEDAIFPVKIAGIPINIKNTNEPTASGTRIVATTEQYQNEYIITGIAGKKGFALINIEKDMMNSELGFGMKVLSVLAEMGINFEHLPSGIDTMSVVVAESAIKGRERQLLSRISALVSPDNIDIEKGICLIAVVGRGMIRTQGTACRVFDALAREGINIRMIDQGSSELNIIIGVEEHDFDSAIRTVYNEFVD
ncbi:MAG: aspartate kinase [Clostridia bacterium]|nr:aspartate kinase [Clostridia bacterium]